MAALVNLDFREHGLEKALEMLLDMAKSGAIDSIVFAARSTSRKGVPPFIFGCEGRLADNRAESIGAAVLLQRELE